MKFKETKEPIPVYFNKKKILSRGVIAEYIWGFVCVIYRLFCVLRSPLDFFDRGLDMCLYGSRKRPYKNLPSVRNENALVKNGKLNFSPTPSSFTSINSKHLASSTKQIYATISSPLFIGFP